MKNLWKYPFLLSTANLVAILFYTIYYLCLYGNEIMPLSIQLWLNISLGAMASSILFGVLTNIRLFVDAIKKFLE